MTDRRKTQELIAAFEHYGTLLTAISRHASDIAHARRTLFNAYLAEGFTEAQALELCKVLT